MFFARDSGVARGGAGGATAPPLDLWVLFVGKFWCLSENRMVEDGELIQNDLHTHVIVFYK